MSTDFTTNVEKITGALLPSASDIPLDIRTRVETEADIMDIPKPYIGMIVYVKDTGKRYEILTLKNKKQGPTIVKNAAVDTYKEFGSEYATKVALASTDSELDTAQENITTLEEALSKLLHPYKAPGVSLSVIRTPESLILEKGETVNVAKLETKIVKNSDDITKVVFYQNDTVLKTITENVAAGGTFEYSFENAVQLQDDITKEYFRVEATDASNNIIGANAQDINFVYPYYFGVIDENESIDGNIIKSFNKVIEVKKDQSYTYTSNNQHMVFAFPKAYESLSKIVDANGFILTATFEVEEVDVECLDGTTQTYYVYKNGASTISNYNITFKF